MIHHGYHSVWGGQISLVLACHYLVWKKAVRRRKSKKKEGGVNKSASLEELWPAIEN